MYDRTIEQIVMNYAIKYQALSKLVSATFKESKYAQCTNINLYIDITRIIRSCADVDSHDPLSLSANILNLCAHYKSFFRRGFGVECKIFLIYSTGEFRINKMQYKNYHYPLNQTSPYWETDKMIISNREALKVVCPYLSDICYIETTEEPAVVMANIHLEENFDNTIPDIVITKDIYEYQLVTNYSSFFIFRPKKVSKEDVSYVVKQDTILAQYQIDRKYKSVVLDTELSPEFLPLFMAICGTPERCIKSKMNFKSLMNALIKAINDVKILNQYQANAAHVIESISKYTSAKLNSYEIDCVYKSLDLYQVVSAYYYMISPSNRYNGIVNLIDPNGVNQISETYYKKTPVDFPVLTS